MTNLVTVFGGSGFLGRHTVRALADAGYRIRVAVRRPNLANYLLPMGQVGQIQIVKANVLKPKDVTAAISGADAVVNLVGVLYARGRQSFENLHVKAAETIATAAKAADAKVLVHLSSMGVSPKSPSAYARSKAAGEWRVREAFPAATILRPSIVFGPEDAFFNRFATLARYLPFLPLVGGGRTRFQPVFAGDVAAAVLKAVADPALARGRTYELGGPSVYTFRELMEFILKQTARKRALIGVPFWLASLEASWLQFLPNPPLTPDQVRLLKQDNVMSPGALALCDLGIQPDSVEAIVPSYLWRFRPKGQYQAFARGA